MRNSCSGCGRMFNTILYKNCPHCDHPVAETQSTLEDSDQAVVSAPSSLSVQYLFETVRDVLLKPRSFFHKMYQGEGAMKHALIFWAITSVLSIFASQLWCYVFPGNVMYTEMDVTALGFMPFLYIILIYLMGAYNHLLLKLFRAAKKPFSSTMLVTLYSNGAVALLAFIPFLGVFASIFWIFVATVQGFSEVHGSSSTRVFLALIMLPVILSLLAIIMIVLIAAAGVMTIPAIINEFLSKV